MLIVYIKKGLNISNNIYICVHECNKPEFNSIYKCEIMIKHLFCKIKHFHPLTLSVALPLFAVQLDTDIATICRNTVICTFYVGCCEHRSIACELLLQHTYINEKDAVSTVIFHI